jgi:hypothetical protein
MFASSAGERAALHVQDAGRQANGCGNKCVHLCLTITQQPAGCTLHSCSHTSIALLIHCFLWQSSNAWDSLLHLPFSE